jgi:uncharacterized protein
MKIETHHIPSGGLDLSYDVPAETFPALKELSDKGECGFETPISVHLEVTQEKDFIKTRGDLSTTLKLACARCLAEYEQRIQSRFSLNHSKQIPTDLHPSDKDEIELTAEQIGVLFYKGDEIDFTEAVQEQVVLAIPYRPLCSKECQGLCPSCGKDLNQGPCQCSRETSDGPFAALKGLKFTE